MTSSTLQQNSGDWKLISNRSPVALPNFTSSNSTATNSSLSAAITDDSTYIPSPDAVLFFTKFIYGTLGSMAFLILVVLFLQYVGGQTGEHFRIFKHILRHGRWSEQTSRISLRQQTRSEFDDKDRILGRSRGDGDEENIDENGDFDSDAFSMNVRSNQNDPNFVVFSSWSR